MKKTCSLCKKDLSLVGFYSNVRYKGRVKHKPMCKPCEIKSNRKQKFEAIKEAYGKPLKCERCGYNKNFSALDFHHLDPSKKDYKIRSTHVSREKIKRELSHCILLCSNCHREEHNPNTDMGALWLEQRT